MSYRDIRNFTEMVRALGFPRMISMESFRQPNFPLLANLLIWLAKRFEPEAELPQDVNTEEDRVIFIRSIAQFMAIKANIKLNTKRLYQADGYSIKELLKITSMLYEALIVSFPEKNDFDEQSELSIRDFDISDKTHDLKQSRQLASEITMTGATLFDLLGKEIDLRVSRQISVGKQYEVSDVEKGITNAIEKIKNEIKETKQLIDNVSATETSLDSKIDRRKMEIDRYEKRLQTLKKVRPAFLEEFTLLEAELGQLFVQYSVRSRCLVYLEKLAGEAERSQKQRQLASSVKIIPTTLPLDDPVDLGIDDDIQEQKPPPSRQERPRARTGGRTQSQKSDIIPFAGFNINENKNESSLGISSDSDTDDDLFLDKDEPELGQSDEDSLGLELSTVEPTNKRAPSGRLTSSKILENNSDDDF